MGILITAPQDKAYERGFAKGWEKGLAIGRRAGREKGRAEARERMLDFDRRVQDWFRRYKDARARGEHFDELPPPLP